MTTLRDTNSNTIDVQVAEFPAPMCDVCALPMWLNKRINTVVEPHEFLRLGFQCRACGAQMRLHGQKPYVVLAGPQ